MSLPSLQMASASRKKQVVSGNIEWPVKPIDRRILAWGALTVGLLLLRSASSPLLFALAALAGSFGMQNLLSVTAPFGISSSTRALRTTRKSPGSPHGVPRVRLIQPPHLTVAHTVMVGFVALLSLGAGLVFASHLLALLIVLMATAAVVSSLCYSVPLQLLSIGAAYYLLALDGRPQVLAVGIALTLLLSVVAYLRRQWLPLGVTACLSLLLCVLLPLSVGPIYAVVGLLPIGLAVATRERFTDEREQFRQLLVPVNILASIAFLQSDVRWLAAPIVLNILLAALAWERKRRVSYAKYFVLLAAAHLALILFITLQGSWLVLLLLLASVGMVALGASIGSLTARLSGIAVLTLSLILFTSLVMPFSGNGLLGRDGIGFLIAVTLPAFADWYSSVESKRAERRLQDVVSGGSAVFSAVTMFALIMLDTEGVVRNSMLIVFGLVLLRLRGGVSSWRTAAWTVAGSGAVLLCTVDVLQGQHTGNVLAAVILVCLSGLSLWTVARRNSLPAVY